MQIFVPIKSHADQILCIYQVGLSFLAGKCIQPTHGRLILAVQQPVPLETVALIYKILTVQVDYAV